MPYGVDKQLGGDNESNTKFMEKCVDSVVKTGKNKQSAIAICKAQLKKKSKSSLEFTELDLEIVSWFDLTRTNYIKRLMNSGMSFHEAESQFESDLARGKVFNL